MPKSFPDIRSLYVDTLDHCRTTSTGCVEWIGVPRKDGYTQRNYRYKAYLLHRLAWIACYGTIPEGKDVLHRCDNRACCNIEHLWLGSHSDNMRDMYSKNRGKQKLTCEDVQEIKFLFWAGAKQRALAKIYGVAFQTINKVIRHRKLDYSRAKFELEGQKVLLTRERDIVGVVQN